MTLKGTQGPPPSRWPHSSTLRRWRPVPTNGCRSRLHSHRPRRSLELQEEEISSKGVKDSPGPGTPAQVSPGSSGEAGAGLR